MPKEPAKKPAAKKPAAKKKSPTLGSSSISLEELQALADKAPVRPAAGSKGGRPKGSTPVSPEVNAAKPASRRLGEESKRQKVNRAIAKGTLDKLSVDELPQSMVHDGVPVSRPFGKELFKSAEDHANYLQAFGSTQGGAKPEDLHVHPWSKFMSETGEPHYVDFNTDNMTDAQFKVIPVVHDSKGNPSLKMRNSVAGVVTRMQAANPDSNIRSNYLGSGVFHFSKQDKYCADCNPRNPQATKTPPFGLN
jgi:hypothetical protein